MFNLTDTGIPKTCSRDHRRPHDVPKNWLKTA